MYKVLSNLKFMGKLYVKDDVINLPKRLGKELEDESIVEVLKETGAEKKKREDVKKKRKDDEEKVEKEKTEKEKADAVKEYEDVSDDELINTLETMGIDHKNISREECIELIAKNDKKDVN